MDGMVHKVTHNRMNGLFSVFVFVFFVVVVVFVMNFARSELAVSIVCLFWSAIKCDANVG